jgi:hypothetical protein
MPGAASFLAIAFKIFHPTADNNCQHRVTAVELRSGRTTFPAWELPGNPK